MKKYCGVDLSTTSIRTGNRVKKFKNLDTVENLCFNAWCVWEIASKQQTHLIKLYHNIENVIGKLVIQYLSFQDEVILTLFCFIMGFYRSVIIVWFGYSTYMHTYICLYLCLPTHIFR